jgi:hypothetical protein
MGDRVTHESLKERRRKSPHLRACYRQQWRLRAGPGMFVTSSLRMTKLRPARLGVVPAATEMTLPSD